MGVLGGRHGTIHMRRVSVGGSLLTDSWLVESQTLMQQYRALFPEVWEAVQANPKQDLYDASQVFAAYVPPATDAAVTQETSAGGDSSSESTSSPAAEPKPNWLVRLQQVQQWLESLPTASMPLVSTEHASLSRDAIKHVEATAIEANTRVRQEIRKPLPVEISRVCVCVRACAIYISLTSTSLSESRCQCSELRRCHLPRPATSSARSQCATAARPRGRVRCTRLLLRRQWSSEIA